ncbi:MAG: pyridoxamine 5'-phosphate oxidase family protein [Syntrophobacterales bacterium]|jgi:nitroimidazol reductase NimA-like FMN-containing flavoprotein (pyridoxamine 5'-phosphate oxidase superfamily)
MKNGNKGGTAVAEPALFALLRELFESQRSAALATQQEGQPYLSLMAFAATPDLKQLVVATERDTRKYANLMAEPRVALLIDNRSNVPSDTEEAVAVTVLGRASEAQPGETASLLTLFLAKHPHLETFVSSPTCALITVRVDTYVVVQHFQEVRDISMTSKLPDKGRG